MKTIFNEIAFYYHTFPDYIEILYSGIRKSIILKENSGCYECISHRKDNYGYAGIKLKGKMIKVHRLSYCLFNKLPDQTKIKNKILRHTCDNPACCFHKHLIPGTHEENMWDKMERERNAIGSKIGSSKLTEIDIPYIVNSSYGNKQLAEMFNVNIETIRRIKKRETWKHIRIMEDIII